MKRSQAFTLFELVVYCGVISIVIPIVFSFFSRGIYEIRRTISTKEMHIKNTVALSALRSDIVSASMDRREWDEPFIVFKKYYRTVQGEFIEQWVSWDCCKEGLRRSSGEWDLINQKWLKKSTSIFHCDISDLSVKRKGTKNSVQGIFVTYSIKNTVEPQTLYLRLRNRMVA